LAAVGSLQLVWVIFSRLVGNPNQFGTPGRSSGTTVLFFNKVFHSRRTVGNLPYVIPF